MKMSARICPVCNGNYNNQHTVYCHKCKFGINEDKTKCNFYFCDQGYISQSGRYKCRWCNNGFVSYNIYRSFYE